MGLDGERVCNQLDWKGFGEDGGSIMSPTPNLVTPYVFGEGVQPKFPCHLLNKPTQCYSQ